MSDAPPINPAQQDQAEGDEIMTLFSIGASLLARTESVDTFLNWIEEHGPTLAPRIAANIDPRSGPIGRVFRVIGISIYNATPLPLQDFNRRPLSKPGRNQKCWCGSGSKYKHCCQSVKLLPDFTGYNMLRHILDCLPKKSFNSLPKTAVEVSAVADTARQWMDEGDLRRAQALLEPWFKDGQKLTGKLEPAFDILMDVNFGLGQQTKRQRLLKRVLAAGDRTLRVAALQRQASIHADQGDMASAWESFRQAQREDPDDPALCLLEMTLLVSRNEIDRAKARARFWVKRLQHSRHGDPELIEIMIKMSEDPAAAMVRFGNDSEPELGRLQQLFESAPAAMAHYKVDLGEDIGLLQPQEILSKLESEWSQIYPRLKPQLTCLQLENTEAWSTATSWLNWLERNPIAWHSLEILDDLVLAVDTLEFPGIIQTLLLPLLDRSVELLNLNLASQLSSEETLPWMGAANRPALRLLAHRAFIEQDIEGTKSEVFQRLAKQMLTLNPNDNHDFRSLLSTGFLETGKPQLVVALSADYPDDFCILTLNNVLALYQLERSGEALTALMKVSHRHHAAITMLLATKPNKPKSSSYGLEVGGKEEAWLYREAHLHLWKSSDALAWLRDAWRSVPNKKRRR